jgi:hypothetical protein
VSILYRDDVWTPDALPLSYVGSFGCWLVYGFGFLCVFVLFVLVVVVVVGVVVGGGGVCVLFVGGCVVCWWWWWCWCVWWVVWDRTCVAFIFECAVDGQFT